MSFRAWQRITIAGLLFSVGWLFGPGAMLANPPMRSHPIRTLPKLLPKAEQCPTDLATLVDRMLRNLPSYINRVRTRAGIRKSYVVLAARPEFEPLPLSGATPPTSENTQQVFFTTLMRRYEGDRITYLQEYHWVFLTPSAQGWQLAMMYSTIGSYPANADQPPLPPRNSSDGSVAQSIRDWLSDCQSQEPG
jgi:hypothetical protein